MRRRISGKGSHTFATQVTSLVLQQLGYDAPDSFKVEGEVARACGEVIRHMSVGALMPKTAETLSVYGEFSRSLRSSGTKAWKRAVVSVAIGTQTWVAYIKRDSEEQLTIGGLWPLEDA